MINGIVEFIEAQLDHEAELAQRVADRYVIPEDAYIVEKEPERAGQPFWPTPTVESAFMRHPDPDISAGLELVRMHSPARVLADVQAKRAILAEVLSWNHAHIDGDTWLSCAQAVDPHDEDGTPGSGCADEKRAGGPCDCGLDRRRVMMLNALAAAYAGRPGFKPEWRLS